MMLVKKVFIFGVFSSSMMLSFGGMLLLDPSSRSEMRHERVSMYRQHLMMISPLYDI